MKTFIKTISVIIYVVVVILSVLIIISILPIKNTYKLLTVMSGSMEPSIKTGALIVSKPSESYMAGDVITFRPKNTSSNKETTTHRISREEKDQFGTVKYFTKGDANNGEDATPVYHQQILGKYILGVPYMGYFIYYVKTLPGLIIIILIPATIIIYEEAKKIQKEAKEIIKKRKSKKSSSKKSSKKSSDPKANNQQPTTYNLSKRGGKRAPKDKKNN